MKKRLFVSIAIPVEWRDAFVEYYTECAVRDVRWTPKENIHITACFLGDVDVVHIDDIKEKLKNLCARIESFSLSFENISFAPPGMPPRMIWVMFAPSDAYLKLTEEMQETLRSFLSVEPHTETVPHATLARFKNPGLAREIDLSKSLPKLATFDVRSVTLVESRLDPVDVRHEALETFLFGKTV